MSRYPSAKAKRANAIPWRLDLARAGGCLKCVRRRRLAGGRHCLRHVALERCDHVEAASIYCNILRKGCVRIPIRILIVGRHVVFVEHDVGRDIRRGIFTVCGHLGHCRVRLRFVATRCANTREFSDRTLASRKSSRPRRLIANVQCVHAFRHAPPHSSRQPAHEAALYATEETCSQPGSVHVTTLQRMPLAACRRTSLRTFMFTQWMVARHCAWGNCRFSPQRGYSETAAQISLRLKYQGDIDTASSTCLTLICGLGAPVLPRA